MSKPRLEAFALHADAPRLVASTTDRAWMDAFPDRHAYRCLPLTIANAHCWELLAPGSFDVSWNGRAGQDDLTVRPLEDWPDSLRFQDFAVSNFHRGIVTLHTGYLFRTPPGWNLLTTGPFNEPRAGIAPLTGLIEADWLPYPFTMNWQMVTAGTVRFHKDDVFCIVMPVPKNYLPDWDIVVHDLADDPVLAAEHGTFRQSRETFEALKQAGAQAAPKEHWQRHYFLGRHPDGTPNQDHLHKLRLEEPLDRRGTRPANARPAPASAQAARIMAAGPETHAAAPTAVDPPRPKWRADSILTEIDHRQNEANSAGRARLRDGVLTATQETTYITPDMDAAAFDFVLAPDFMTTKECAALAEAATALADRQHVEGIKVDFWKGRILFFQDVLAGDPMAAEIMRRVQARVTSLLAEFYALTEPVHADTVQLVQWRQGMFMPAHCDRAFPDGSRHETPHRDFASIIYLNDDFAGGELYFPRLDLVVQPRAGTLVAFTGGWHHEHAVLQVRSGLRLTMPAFYTFDRGRLDATFYA